MYSSTLGAVDRTLRGPLLTAAAVVLVLVGVSLAGGFVALLAFSALAAIVCRRAELWLIARGWRPWLSVVVVIAGFVLILVIMAVAVVAAVVAIGLTLVEQADQVQAWIDRLQELWGSITGVPGGTLPSIEPQQALGVARAVVASLAPGITSLAFAVLIVIYLLLGANGLRRRMTRATSEAVLVRYDVLAGELVTYVKVRAALGAAAALADTLLLLVLGVPYAVLWGLMSFLFSFIPNLGFILALIPPTLFAFLESGPIAGVAVVVGYVVINLAFDYVIQPRLFASTLELSPVVTIVTILAWTALIGPAGALLAVPLTIALRAALLPFPGARWFLALLGTEGPEDDPPAQPPADPDAGTPGEPAAPGLARTIER